MGSETRLMRVCVRGGVKDFRDRLMRVGVRGGVGGRLNEVCVRGGVRDRLNEVGVRVCRDRLMRVAG